MADIAAGEYDSVAGRRATARRLRLVAFALIATFIVGGPFVRQIAGIETHWLRGWTMFSAIGLGVIDARFTIRDASGVYVPLVRFELLQAPRDGRIKRIDDTRELETVVDRLCKAAGTGADIRVVARQAVRNGWAVVDDGTRNACGHD